METVEAGLALEGSEVKSLRDGRASINESFARPDGNEIYLYNMHISPYEYSSSPQDPLRARKILLHKNQIRYLISQVSQKGLTLIPLKLYFKRGFAKVELALAKGKRQYDKREAIKRREAERAISRAKKFTKV